MKEALLQWVSGQHQLDVVSKFILWRLAQYADADCCAWAKVKILADECNVSERTVQTRLRTMEKARLISATGKPHRIGTRHVPIYRIAPDEVFGTVPPWPMAAKSMGEDSAPMQSAMGENPAPIMGADFAPIPACGQADLHPYGCNCLHPYKDMKGQEESADALSTRARQVVDPDFESVVAAFEAADPHTVAGPLDRSAWKKAAPKWGGPAIAAAAPRYLADCRARGNRPYSVAKWLQLEKFAPFLTERVVVDAGKPAWPPEGWAFGSWRDAGPEFVAAVEAAERADWIESWLARAGWDGERRIIVTATSEAARHVARDLRRLLADCAIGVERWNGVPREAAA